ncbi:MAG TPA: GNAT family N-acetyltransferase [Kribbellaceae bacterium]
MLPSIAVRDARSEDADVLVTLWEEMSFGTGHSRLLAAPSTATAGVAIERLGAEPSARLVVGELDGEVRAMAYLRRTPLSPLHDEDTVRVEYLHVRDDARRHGLGKALIAEAAAWADETDSQHLAVMASATERDANRFLARLGLSQFVVLRLASTHVVRRRLAAEQAANVLGALATRRTTLARRAALLRGTRTPFTVPVARESAGK